MALTLTQQLNILNGVVAPPSNTLDDLVKQAALVEAVNFVEKDTTGNTDAASYKSKIESVIRLLYNNASTMTTRLKYILVAIYAPTGDYATVQAAGDSGWETFISNNILESMEEFALVTSAEKTAYDSI